jgi:hypothetical protein
MTRDTRRSPLLSSPKIYAGVLLALLCGASGVQGDVAEIFADRCWDCHGPDKQKAKLRLDTAEGIASVVTPGDPATSELFFRVTLPSEDDDRMPPKGDPLSAEQIAEVEAWIIAGAPWVGVASSTEAIAAASEALVALQWATGALVVPLSGDPSGPIRVDFSHVDDDIPEAALAALAPFAPVLGELSLAGHDVAWEGVAAMGPFPVLEVLKLERSTITDDAIAPLLRKTPALVRLNLHSTAITSAIEDHISTLENLRRLVLFNTPADRVAHYGQLMRGNLLITGAMELAPAFVKSGPRRLLAADSSSGRIALMQQTTLETWETLWEHSVESIHDLHVLENGNILFQDTWTHLLEVDPVTGDVVWEYDAATANRDDSTQRVEVHAFERLADGTTMIAESGAGRIIEVSADGTLVREIPLMINSPDAHHDTRLVRSTPTGTYLVAHEKDGVVREYDRAGEIVFSFDVPLGDRAAAPGNSFDAWGDQVFSAVRLTSGNTLIGTGNGHGVLEVNPKGEVVWQLGQDDLEGIRLSWVTTVQELSNGNLVITNCHAGPDQPQIIEITRDKEVVWTFLDFERLGNSLSNAVIIEDQFNDR